MRMYDFAISYAGEDKLIAERIVNGIKSYYDDFSIFYAPNEQHQLVGQDGECYFEQLFTNCKEVIVLISENYKKKIWTRYEWDIILKRNKENRFIPIRLDDTIILGLPSNIISLYYKNNISEIAEICIKKLLLYEKQNGINRKSDFDNVYASIIDSEGSLDKAFQLVVDKRKREPLANINYPTGSFTPKYSIVERNWLNFSVIKRLELRILLPKKLAKVEVEFNIKHSIASEFNKEKPDALCVFAFCKDNNFDGFKSVFNVARADFAPYGKWEKAEEGFTYNLPIEKFRTKIEYFNGYFDPDVKKRTPDTIAKELLLEVLKKRNKK
jgi:hypothetical protein